MDDSAVPANVRSEPCVQPRACQEHVLFVATQTRETISKPDDRLLNSARNSFGNPSIQADS